MKVLINILFVIISLQLFAQNTLQNYSISVSEKIESIENLNSFLSRTLQLEENKISLKQIHEVESLTGKHFTFELLYNDLSIHKTYIKAHINKEQKLYFIQHNYSSELFQEFQTSTVNQDQVYKTLYESFVIDKLETVYALNSEAIFTKAILVSYFQEVKDVYNERIYFSVTDFLEKDLKVHFAPQDTLLKGKAFAPDPLSSSGNEYGTGDYRDEFIKDTIMLTIKTIPNMGQTGVSAGSNNYTLYGINFSIDDKTVDNLFSGSDIYFVFENIYIDVDNAILGYNTFFTDTLGYKTKIITEDYGFVALDNEQIDIEVVGDFSSSEFKLKNKYFEISDFSLPISAPYSSTINDFTFSRSNDFFEGINAFYHLNNFHDYVEELGFENLDPSKVAIDVHGSNGADNSFFTNSPTPRLIFGDGGVDDAEDADVVVHEYTHALSYFASPGTNNGAERKALDEALGDYFCSTYSASFYEFNQFEVFSWDGHNDFWNGRVSNLDSSYLSLDLSKSIYFNAQIMSATLMDIYNVLGREITDVLVLESLFFNVSENNFVDVADNLLRIDSMIYDDKHRCDIFKILVERKVKEGICIGETVLSGEGLTFLNSAAFSLGKVDATLIINEEGFEKLDYWVTDAIGKVVLKQENISDSFFKLKPEMFQKGIYYLRIQTNNTKYKTKFVKAN